MKNKKFVIVGAGLAGLFAARVLRSFGVKKINIIEKSNDIGGLLGNQKVKPLKDGLTYDFDYGTHFVLSTNNSKVNSLINIDLEQNKYYRFENSLLEAQYFNGILYQKSSAPNLFNLPSKIHNQIKKELKQGLGKNQSLNNYFNLDDLYSDKFGITAKKYIFSPILKKFTNLDLKDLSTNMDNSFFPSRLIIEDSIKSKVRKEDPYWDSRIAFANCIDGNSSIVKYYPKKGGIGEWVNTIFSNLKNEGVKFSLNTNIKDLKIKNRRVTNVYTSDEEKLDCDRILWTLPPSLFSFISDLKLPSSKPNFREVIIINFIFDLRPIKYPYYINVYDSSLKSFRVTIYDNFNNDPDLKKKYRITVEVLHDTGLINKQKLISIIFQELKLMKIIPPATRVLWSNIIDKKISFPIFTPVLVKTLKKQIENIENSIDNVNLIGRKSNIHGQIAIMENVYEEIKNYFN